MNNDLKFCEENTLEKMIKIAREAQKNAYAPYSHYPVGVCLRAEDDQLFAGCNVENVSYGLTQCAEASAIGCLITSGHKRIKEAVIIGSGEALCTPCGACRQRLWEFALTPDILIHLCNQYKIQLTVPLNKLLPGAFDIEHLEKNK